jgi:hypothetical protein
MFSPIIYIEGVGMRDLLEYVQSADCKKSSIFLDINWAKVF